jgi:2-polyprenyl-3-methyl-5-hydroxy-6-metoxy-1,4-benzoquinol methylase
MFCDEGLHEACFKQIKNFAKDSRILVLGSGGGAFDQRLVDNGFTNVTSLDFRPDFFRATGTSFVEKDLNENFSDLGTFDLIVAIELIEHLENPAHFMRNISKCLHQNGSLLVTTPNIESGPSRVAFLTMGTLSFFTEEDMYGSGHISPLLHHIFAFHVKNAGLIIKIHTSNRNAWGARAVSNVREITQELGHFNVLRSITVCIKTVLLVILSPLTLLRGRNGNIHIYVISKE